MLITAALRAYARPRRSASAADPAPPHSCRASRWRGAPRISSATTS